MPAAFLVVNERSVHDAKTQTAVQDLFKEGLLGDKGDNFIVIC